MTHETDSQSEVWQKLRQCIHDKMRGDLRKRRKTNPVPTTEEIQLGEYMEMIEPQVRYAVLELNRKGYSTFSSGFHGATPLQVIDCVRFMPDEGLIYSLHTMGVSIEQHRLGWTTISFYPESVGLEEVEKKWKAIADIFSDTGKPAPPRGRKSDFGPRQWPDGEIM